jgi:hypothetical protein
MLGFGTAQFKYQLWDSVFPFGQKVCTFDGTVLFQSSVKGSGCNEI